MAKTQQTDPYAPPPMHHDRSGSVVRFAIMAALLGAAAVGYMSFTGSEPQSAGLAPVEQTEPQQMADGSYQVTPQPTTTEAAPQSAVPAPSPAPAARSTVPAPSEPADAVPPPSTSITPVEPISPAG
jgi:hypothetical protein